MLHVEQFDVLSPCATTIPILGMTPKKFVVVKRIARRGSAFDAAEQAVAPFFRYTTEFHARSELCPRPSAAGRKEAAAARVECRRSPERLPCRRCAAAAGHHRG